MNENKVLFEEDFDIKNEISRIDHNFDDLSCRLNEIKKEIKKEVELNFKELNSKISQLTHEIDKYYERKE